MGTRVKRGLMGRRKGNRGLMGRRIGNRGLMGRIKIGRGVALATASSERLEMRQMEFDVKVIRLARQLRLGLGTRLVSYRQQSIVEYWISPQIILFNFIDMSTSLNLNLTQTGSVRCLK